MNSTEIRVLIHRYAGAWPSTKELREYADLLEQIEHGEAIVLRKDSDGDWEDWIYEYAAHRLENVGGLMCKVCGGQWSKPTYRMAYLAVVLKGLLEGSKVRLADSQGSG